MRLKVAVAQIVCEVGNVAANCSSSMAKIWPPSQRYSDTQGGARRGALHGWVVSTRS
jgi:hypothetical protein